MTDDIRLRHVEESDLPLLFEHQNDAEANHMANFPARDREAFMAHWAKILRDESVVTQSIVYRGELAGSIVAWGPPEERLVGYWIGRAYWGRGIASEALKAFLDRVRERPLFAHVARHNAGSIRVLEKCGFTRASEGDQELIMRLEATGSAPAP